MIQFLSLKKYQVQYINNFKNCQQLLKNEKPFLKLPMYKLQIFISSGNISSLNIRNFKNGVSLI
jgi:hypothetical protein